MEINSNTILINKVSEEFKEIETILTRIAAENGIEDVGSINISFDQEEGIISFKKAMGLIADDEKLNAANLPKLRENFLHLENLSKSRPNDSILREEKVRVLNQIQAIEKADKERQTKENFEITAPEFNKIPMSLSSDQESTLANIGR